MDVPTFESLRPYLFSVAYRMLGSASDAEDVVQDAWLRSGAAPPNLASGKAWLTRVVTRLCLDRLKSARARREAFVGPWLPEPVPTQAAETGEDVSIRRESITLAFLVLLETLTPAERAAFLLREVFDCGYDDVAETLDTTEAAARQLVHRARSRIAEGRPRFRPSPDRQREIVSAFLAAVQQGDVTQIERYLSADVAYTADGGGKASAARKVVVGVEAVGRLMHALMHKAAPSIDAAADAWSIRVSSLNGEPALLVSLRDTLDSAFVFSTDEEAITAIRAVRNPEKLTWLAAHLEE